MKNNIYPNHLTYVTLIAPCLLSGCNTEPSMTEQGIKPNIVWYMTEDLSPQYLALYNDGEGAPTPNLSEFSEDAIIFDNAYSNAPVSSAARTTLITGCYAPHFGGSLHRKLQALPMPKGLKMVPSYLRKTGYYTCNAAKTDYNVILDTTAWDKINGKLGDWSLRKDKKQPFFYVRTNAVTHESKLLFPEKVYNTKKTIFNPDSVHIHPNLPDTKLMRYTYATFYDKIAESDKEFGLLLDMLKKDELLDNTFIFFFGDNGGCVPGTKGYTNDTGLHVPLLVYVPQKWRKEIGIEAGKHCDRLVSFMDFGPTILKLTGIDTPKQMDGVAFMGDKISNEKQSIICYGDRFDDLYAFNRVLYKGDFRYSRNYQPYHSQSQYTDYRYKSLALREWREMFKENKLNKNQSKFFEPFGCEELYDLKNDPNELNNLTNDSKYQKTLLDMREDLANQIDKKGDLGFLPETIILEEAIKNPAEYADSNRQSLVKYRKIADLQLKEYEEAEAQIKKSLLSDDIIERWWALTTATAFDKDASSIKDMAEKSLLSERGYERARAIVFLSKLGEKFSEDEFIETLKLSKTEGECLLILNDFTHLKEVNLLPKFKNISEKDAPFICYGVKERINYLKN